MSWTPVAEVIATGGPHDKEDRVLVELVAELPPIGAKLYAAKPEFDLLQAKYQRLENGVNEDLAEIDRIQSVYDEQFRKGRKLRMERDKLLSEIERLKSLSRAVVEEQMSHVRVHPCDEHSEDIKARQMPQVYQDLYEALK